MTKDVKSYDYDAYICHAPADKDRNFVNTTADLLEKSPFNLKLFLPERDIKGDMDEIELTKIVKRCRKFVVILTSEFHKDSMSEYLLKMVFSSNRARREGKIIPVILENCKVPSMIRHITNCDFTKTELHDWLFPRLAHSIKHVRVR